MTEIAAERIRRQARFKGIEPFPRHLPLTAPFLHGNEEAFLRQALEEGFQDSHIAALEKEIATYIGVKYAAALSSGTVAVHMAVKLAAERLYGSASGISTPDGLGKGGALYGKRVFCADFAPASLAFPILYEGGEPVFIDASPEDWGMEPEVLELAFKKYPDVRLVLMHHAYGFPGQIKRIKAICKAHGALLIEDASTSLGARVNGEGRQAGSLGDYGILDFGKDRIITGGRGGMLLCHDAYSYHKAKHWASLARAEAAWEQYEELGYEEGMDALLAGVIRAQLQHLKEHIERKKRIYERYQEKLDRDLICMNPAGEGTEPNYWMSCILLESGIHFREARSERDYVYETLHGTAAPMELYDALQAFNAESRPLYKPLHMQPIFKNHEQITLDGGRRTYEDFYDDAFWVRGNVGKYNFETGLCLPSDVHMTEEEQDRVIEIVHAGFD